MKISQALAASTLALLFAGGANALQITTEAGGVTTSSVTGVAVETFNNTADFIDGLDITCGLYSSCSGDFTVYDTPSGTGRSAPPAGISSYYLSVPNPDETDNHAFATVPEPATLALLALGLTGLILARRRKKA